MCPKCPRKEMVINLSEKVAKKVGRPKKPKKVTWDDVFKDFKQRHPRTAKTVINWYPTDIGVITVVLSNRDKIIYDYDLHRGTRIVYEED